MNIVQDYDKLITQRINLFKFMDIFSDNNQCLHLYFNIKYCGQKCEKCNRSIIENYVRVGTMDKSNNQKKSFRCRSCHTHIYPLADTVFRGTSIPITHIFVLLFLFSHSKKNTSAIDATKCLPISYKTVHKLSMLIRGIMYPDLALKLKGNIEIDEVFIGKGSKVYNWTSISTRKQPIVGMIERETKQARVFLVDNRNWETLYDLITDNVEYGSTIYTDSWRGYSSLKNHYHHESVDHTRREFVRGEVHTNTIENLWGGFKRNIRNAHIKISAKYVQLYMNELCWRHNYKNETKMQRFDRLLRRTFLIPSS